MSISYMFSSINNKQYCASIRNDVSVSSFRLITLMDQTEQSTLIIILKSTYIMLNLIKTNYKQVKNVTIIIMFPVLKNIIINIL